VFQSHKVIGFKYKLCICEGDTRFFAQEIEFVLSNSIKMFHAPFEYR